MKRYDAKTSKQRTFKMSINKLDGTGTASLLQFAYLVDHVRPLAVAGK